MKIKKKFLDVISIMIAVAVTFAGSDAYVYAKNESAATVQLKKTEGTVGISNGSGRDVSMIDNMKLHDGYHVATEKASYAWTELDSSKLAKLDAVSEMELRKNKKVLEILLDFGNLFFNVTEPLEDDETMNICTSTMVAGIRGTCGWVRVINQWQSRVYILEGSVECVVTDPVTGQTKRIVLNSGEWADFFVYDSQHSGDKCDIVTQGFVREDIPGYVLAELAQPENKERCETIFESSGIDVTDVTVEEAAAKQAADEAEVAEKLEAIEAAEALQEHNISKDPVWTDEGESDTRVQTVNAAGPQTPELTREQIAALEELIRWQEYQAWLLEHPIEIEEDEDDDEEESEPATVYYTVTVIAFNGVTTVSCGSQTVVAGSTIGSLAQPADPFSGATGYTFQGWCSTPSSNNQISDSTAITGNTTVYAYFN